MIQRVEGANSMSLSKGNRIWLVVEAPSSTFWNFLIEIYYASVQSLMMLFNSPNVSGIMRNSFQLFI